MRRLLYRWRLWLGLALVWVGVAAYLVYVQQREHARVQAVELERLDAQVKVVEANLARQWQAINLGLESIVAELPQWHRAQTDNAEATEHLKILERVMPSVRTFVVLDANGSVVLSNREELVGRNFYQRDYFQAPLHDLNPKKLYVSPPFKSVLGNYLVNLSRVMLDRRGHFAGVVTAAIDPQDVSMLLGSVRYSNDMRVMLVHGSGKGFVSVPASEKDAELDFSAPTTYVSQHLQSGRAASHYMDRSDQDDQRLWVLHTFAPGQLAMNQAMVVLVSRRAEQMFAGWHRDLASQLLAYAALLLLSAIGLLFYQRQLGQQRLSAKRLKLATQASGIGIWEYELSSRCYHWDAKMFDLFGLDSKQVDARNSNWRELLLPGELERMKDATRATIRSGEPFHLTFQIRCPNGELRFLRNRAALYQDSLGRPNRLVGVTENVTQRKLQEADLRLTATVFDCQESIVVTNPDKVILRINHAFTEMFGYSAQEAIGQTPRLLKSGRHDRDFYVAMWEHILREGHWKGEVWNRRKDGTVFLDLLNISAVTNDAGVVTHYVGTHLDITERNAAEEAIKQLAFYDPLTGLPNRRLLQDRLQRCVSQVRRDHKRLALLFIDLDRFKPVNDEFGHAVGDELLAAVAQRLQACVRESDTVARVGGDEFVILLPTIEEINDALGVAQKIHTTLVQAFTLSVASSVNISSSSGVAIFPEHGSTDEELMHHADAAMYRAKALGRDRFVLFEAPQ